MCEICSKLAMKTPERRHCRSASIVDFEQIDNFWVLNKLLTALQTSEKKNFLMNMVSYCNLHFN